MDFSLAKTSASTSTKKTIDELNVQKKHRYVVLKLKKNLIEVSSIGGKDEECADLLRTIRVNECQYILYRYGSRDIPQFNDQLILIAWIPEKNCEDCDTTLYKRALMFVKRAIRVENVLILRNVNEVTDKNLEMSIRNCLSCLFHKNVVREPSISYVPDSRGLGYVYYNCMSKNKDKTALIEGVTGCTLTYGAVLERAISIAVNLRKMGVKYGDVISYHGYEEMNTTPIFLATFFLGGTICAMDPTFSKEDTTSMLKQISPQKAFVTLEILNEIDQILTSLMLNTEIIVLGDSNKFSTLSSLLVESVEDTYFKPVEAESILDTAVIVFTSGSTGVPKPVCHNHEAALYQYYSFANLEHCWDTVVHFATPQWTVFTKFLGIQILKGGARVFYRSFFETFWDFIKYNVTAAFFSPVEVMTLSKMGRPKSVDLSRLHVILGGNTVDNVQAKLLYEVFYDVEFFFGYGFSEIPNGMTAFKPASLEENLLRRKKPSSVGRALPGFSFKIVDHESEKMLGPNQRGEIRIKTDFFLSGYWKSDSLSMWDDYGWMKTGDLAIYDEDRCLYIVGRLKDMFKYQDYHIIPVVIENVLKTHPDVMQAAVVGIPHLVDGHRPMGVVVLKPNHNVLPEALVDYVDEKVHYSHKLRAGIRIVDKLPLSSSGKVRKVKLQQMILKNTVL